MTMMTIGIVAPSAVVPKAELEAGVRRLREEGFSVRVHPQCFKQHLYFAGQDEARARAFLEFALDPAIDVLWCARGGYGATRILPWLARWTKAREKPKRPKLPKLLIGYSDATVLHEFVRENWGWCTLHAPMPGLKEFSAMRGVEWRWLLGLVRGSQAEGSKFPKLNWLGSPPARPIEGKLIGGNLAVWTSLVGTPFAPSVSGKILFLEDVDESLYRLDRMVTQLALSGGFQGVRAIVLGGFRRCEDRVPQNLSSIRKPIPTRLGLKKIFGFLSESLHIPVAIGLRAGHVENALSLPLGADYRLTPGGEIQISRWKWHP